jgi:hypothetical protein
MSITQITLYFLNKTCFCGITILLIIILSLYVYSI